jgi:CubicO group peptidase (beta-lactamase class C family)
MSMFGRPDGNWAKGFLGQPVTHAPGTHFIYNSGATYMLSAILTRLTGQTLIEYLRPRLFEPLGIANPAWESCPRGINTGGWGLSATIEDIGCFGQLYLQGGSWQGRQLIPAGWVAEATRRQVSNGSAPESDWEQGYGYQFWRCRHNAYRGDGAFGQYCVVLPEQDMVIAMTSGVADMQSVLNIFWSELLPAIHTTALPDAPQAQRELGQLLSGLSLPTPDGPSDAAIAAQISGRRYQIEANSLGISAMTFAFGGEATTITLEDAQGTHVVVAGDRAWRAGTTTLDARAPRLSPPDRGLVPVQMAASGAWVGEGTYAAQLWYTTTPFGLTLTCEYSGDRLTCTPRVHVSFMPDALPTLTGRLAEQTP